MNYNIIINPAELERFIEILPEDKIGQKYFLCLMARKKYYRSLPSDTIMVKRTLSRKKDLVEKIKQLEVEYATYKDFEGRRIPQDSLVLYIKPTPRDLEKTAKKVLIELANRVTAAYDGYDPVQVALNISQETPVPKGFLDFDLDFEGGESKAIEIKALVSTFLNKEAFSFIVTRGGGHILVDPAKVDAKYKSSWYLKMSALDSCDVKGDNLLPVPGCRQGQGYFYPIILCE